ncbi:MAG: hypothetical protein HYY35_06650 [Deltaproteobacteria bacterium]|nr:hypothetical protein [Deltaproteobacteria bacterium]
MQIVGLLLVGVVLGASLVWLATPSRTADLERRIERADRPTDHLAIAPILLTKAKEHEIAAAFHRGLATRYAQRSVPAEAGQQAAGPEYAEMAAHCLRIAEGLEKAASESRALAHGHERLATPRGP